MRRTQAPFADELPRLLSERQMTIRALARLVGVSHTHLSRVLRQANDKSVSPELASRVALALDLDEGYFVEVREELVIQEIKTNPGLRERLYGRLRR